MKLDYEILKPVTCPDCGKQHGKGQKHFCDDLPDFLHASMPVSREVYVFLNGIKLDRCVAADRKAGWAVEFTPLLIPEYRLLTGNVDFQRFRNETTSVHVDSDSELVSGAVGGEAGRWV